MPCPSRRLAPHAVLARLAARCRWMKPGPRAGCLVTAAAVMTPALSAKESAKTAYLTLLVREESALIDPRPQEQG